MEFELLHHIAFFAVIIICCGLIYRIENNKNTGYFSIFVFLSIFGITEITTSNNSISIIIPSVIFSLVFYISKNKYKYTRFPLVYNDIFGFDGKIYRDLFRTYSKEMVLFCFYAFISVILVLALFSFSDGSANHPAVLYSSLAINALGAWFSLPYAMAEYRRANWDGRHISTFFATMLAQGFRPADMTRLTISASPATADIENIEKPADRIGFAPHIIMIGAESTFPPRLFGMPEEPNVAEFFDGTDGVRELKVEIFGGQTIQTHTSCLTGLSMQLFGENRAYVPRFWKGRIGVSLPFFLRSHGYCVAALKQGLKRAKRI